MASKSKKSEAPKRDWRVLRLADFIGLDTCLHVMNVLPDGLGDPKHRLCPLLKQLVAAGRLGDKSGRGVFEYSK